jgi:hypothetical protein
LSTRSRGLLPIVAAISVRDLRGGRVRERMPHHAKPIYGFAFNAATFLVPRTR